MRFLFVLFIALAAGIGLTMLGDKPGYVLISREPWSIETSFTMFIVGLLILISLSYLLLRFVIHMLATPDRIRKWQKRRHRDQAIEDSRRGLAETINGNFDQAEKLLTRRLEDNPLGVINLLTSAWIAQKKEDHQNRDNYIAEASNKAEDTQLPVGIVKCLLQQQAGQTEQALVTAQLLHQQYPSNPAVTRTLLGLLDESEQWQELYAQLSKSDRSHALTEKEHSVLLSGTTEHLLKSATDLQDAHEIWKSLPRKTRKDSAIIASYCQVLNQFSADDEAEILIRNTLKSGWSDDLIMIYGKLATSDLASQLKTAEQWLPEHPTDTQLMLCLGRLAIRNQLWGMARSYLEVAVQNGDSVDAFLELARLFESLEEPDAALDMYKRGLARSLDTLSTGSHARQADPGTVEDDTAAEENPQRPSLAYSNESK